MPNQKFARDFDFQDDKSQKLASSAISNFSYAPNSKRDTKTSHFQSRNVKLDKLTTAFPLTKEVERTIDVKRIMLVGRKRGSVDPSTLKNHDYKQNK
jgi:hypothetical protein